MKIELECVKKIKSKNGKKNKNFFLDFENYSSNNSVYYPSNNKTISSQGIKLPGLKKIQPEFAAYETTNFNAHFGNIPGAVSANYPKSISSDIRSKNFSKKEALQEKVKHFYTAFNSVGNEFTTFTTLSFSLFKQTFPLNWKSIFVHLLEKSNLLVRSDNNTAFSLPKLLQTTTI